MTRGGREKDRDEPERKCIATGESQPKAGLIRFCPGPDGQVVPDIAHTLLNKGVAQAIVVMIAGLVLVLSVQSVVSTIIRAIMNAVMIASIVVIVMLMRVLSAVASAIIMIIVSVALMTSRVLSVNLIALNAASMKSVVQRKR